MSIPTSAPSSSISVAIIVPEDGLRGCLFGTGLYSGDFAMDLRSTIRAVSHLPFTPDRLVEILCESEPGAAKNLRHY
jgi:hypothetical protein